MATPRRSVEQLEPLPNQSKREDVSAGGGEPELTEPSSGWWTLVRGQGLILATAIHAGHAVRPEVQELFAIDESQRLREEDPFTDRWTDIAPNRMIAHRSRFELDLNRPRDGAVYRTPEQAWGLAVWKSPPPPQLIDRSLMLYDSFYAAVELVLGELTRAFGRFIVLDLHSYNHRRDGKNAAPADPMLNPDINVGTGSLKNEKWRPMVDLFIAGLARCTYHGRGLDVRENIRFRGGRFSEWVNTRFGEHGCALAIEVKKIFMDEWTGIARPEDVAEIGRALRSVVPALCEGLN